MKRQSISKRLRFSIFARDSFTCVYCGKQPPEVRLVIEHVIPVCEGGTNSEMNLKTACEECNQGKGARTIAGAVPTEQARLVEAQELMEHRAQLEKLRDCITAHNELFQTVVNRLCEVLGQREVKKASVSLIINLISEFGAARVDQWMVIAGGKYLSEIRSMKYISGIARNTREQEARDA